MTSERVNKLARPAVDPTARAADHAALASRHAGTLGGRVADIGAVAAPVVELVVSERTAALLVGQHLVLHLANLLGRMAGVVAAVRVVGPGAGTSLAPGVDIRDPEGGTSLALAAERASRLAVAEEAPATAGQQPGHEPGGDPANVLRCYVGGAGLVVEEPAATSGLPSVYVAAGAWTAFVGRSPGPECEAGPASASTLPSVRAEGHGGAVDQSAAVTVRASRVSAMGAYAAAALAAAEVFRLVRARGPLAAGPDGFTFNVWAWSPCASLSEGDMQAAAAGADRVDTVRPFTLAGVGAVGSALLLALWACGVAVPDALAVDGDAVSFSNLNRYVLFGLREQRMPKASAASALLNRGGPFPFRVRAVDTWWSEYMRGHAGAAAPRRLLSGVDTNRARHELQDAWPRIILGASTRDLRVEVARYDLATSVSRCLKCFNAPEARESDAAMRQRLLAMDAAALTREAEDRGTASETLRAFVEDLRAGGTGCAVIAGPALEKLRHTDGEGAFAVSFVSSLAGTLMAVQVIRESATQTGGDCDSGSPLLSGEVTRAVFQLWTPGAESNRPYVAPVDPSCTCQQPGYRAAFISAWRTDDREQINVRAQDLGTDT